MPESTPIQEEPTRPLWQQEGGERNKYCQDLMQVYELPEEAHKKLAPATIIRLSGRQQHVFRTSPAVSSPIALVNASSRSKDFCAAAVRPSRRSASSAPCDVCGAGVHTRTQKSTNHDPGVLCAPPATKDLARTFV